MSAAELAGADAPRPADGLLHPVVIGALVLLAVNDQVLKASAPGPLTWILSDVAGLIVAPLALVAAWEIVRWRLGRWSGPSRRALLAAMTAVAVGFIAIQLWPPATDGYRVGLGIVQWPFRALLALVGGDAVPAVTPVLAVGDAFDLLALPALGVTWWLGRRRLVPATRRAGAWHGRT